LPKCFTAKKVILKNYKLTFNELADIIPFEGEEVVGGLYLISKQELEKLDILEGYPDLYDRIVVELEDEFGNKYEALAYTMVEKVYKHPQIIITKFS
jgi:AIG2-like family.